MLHVGGLSLLLLTLFITHAPCGQSLPAPTGPALDRIRTSADHWFVDQHGRVRIFHGVNAVTKKAPWYPDVLLDDARLDDLENWGFNVVRLGAMWAGAEPTRGQYNTTYVTILQKIVKRLSERGIHTLLDMHQDCLTSRYEAYDGVPRWLVDTYPAPTNPFPWPLSSIGAWEEKYLTQAVSEAFQHFYNNVSSSIDAWAKFWGMLAQTFTGNPAVLGYNLMNEPWIGDFYSNITRGYSGLSGAENLLPAYDAINDRIRQHDEEGIIFYEPVIYGQIGHGKYLGSGFDRVPGGAIYRNRSAYSFHAYCWALEFLPPDATDEQRTDARDFCYRSFLPQIVRSSERNVKLTGGSRMLTEFGLCKTGNSKQINVECQFFLDLFDENLLSWVEWDYNDGPWYRDGKPVMEKVQPHVRPYARAVAGIPTRMRYDPVTRHFRLEYNARPSITQPTEIFLPKLVYPDGDVTFKVQGPGRADYKDETLLYIYNTGIKEEAITVKITPKQ